MALERLDAIVQVKSVHIFRNTALACLMVSGALSLGCHSEPQHLLGASFNDAPPAAIQMLAAKPAPASVVVQGEMIEKCPVAGCWFVLKDRTGVVRVDTK